MASAHASGFVSLKELGVTSSTSSLIFPSNRLQIFVPVHSCSIISAHIRNFKNPSLSFAKSSRCRQFRLYDSIELDQLLTSGNEEEMSKDFYEAIEEMEKMAREPSDILGEMNDRLSSRELQLLLVYFSQEGKDTWCALEVFEWLKKENRVDKETMELMASIMCSWIKKLIEEKRNATVVVDLLADMVCVGLKPNFSMIEKVISLYWDMGETEGAIVFVKEVLGRIGDVDKHKGGPAGYLAWKMMVAGNYEDVVRFVFHLRESGLNPSVYTYFVAMSAVVKEMTAFEKALRKLKGFTRSGLIDQLDIGSVKLIEKYQSDVLADGVFLSSWLIQNGSPSLRKLAHEKRLLMYICAGRGLEAEKQLWEMKLAGQEADRDHYNLVLAICASQKEVRAVSRLLTVLEMTSTLHWKKSLSWLLRGYIKGGHFNEAAETLIKMLDLGMYPEFIDRVAVLQGLSKRVPQSVKLETYLKVCKCLYDANLIGPCLVYKYITKYKLWIIKMI